MPDAGAIVEGTAQRVPTLYAVRGREGTEEEQARSCGSGPGSCWCTPAESQTISWLRGLLADSGQNVVVRGDPQRREAEEAYAGRDQFAGAGTAPRYASSS